MILLRRLLVRIGLVMRPLAYDADAEHLRRAGLSKPLETHTVGRPNWVVHHLKMYSKTL